MYKSIQKLLELKTPGEKCKTSFSLNAAEYEKFRDLCKQRGIIPSELIDLFIKEVNQEYNEPE
jgi:hypothetical protein